jgi:hypothetical protein
LGIALAAASLAAAVPALGAERYEDGLAAYQRNDFEKSLKTLHPLALKGDARAQYMLGRHYQFGQGVKADRAEAYYWYRRAEAKGHVEAKLFRQLLEKRWQISAEDKARAERKLATATKPKAEKPPADATALRDKLKPATDAAERAKFETARPKTEAARPAPRAPVRDEAEEDSAAAVPPADYPPPAETRAPMPPGADYAAPHPYPPAYGPSAPYYAPGPNAPYYAPPPPRLRASIYYAPRPYYRPAWGYRPYARYSYPGWRGAGWRGYPGGGFRHRGR